MNAYQKEITDEDYKDVINDLCPVVEIGCLTFSPGDILYELDNVAFNCDKIDYESTLPYICGNCEAEYDDEAEAEECCKQSHLADLLEQAGYEGTDASIEESLFEYCLVYNEQTEIAIFYRDIDNGQFFSTYITSSEIRDVITSMEETDGFFSFIGETKDEYLLELSAPNPSLVRFIQDIDTYNGWFSAGLCNPCTIDDLIQQFESKEE